MKVRFVYWGLSLHDGLCQSFVITLSLACFQEVRQDARKVKTKGQRIFTDSKAKLEHKREPFAGKTLAICVHLLHSYHSRIFFELHDCA